LQWVRDIDRANKARQSREPLEAFLDDVEWLKLKIRLAADLRRISHGKHLEP